MIDVTSLPESEYMFIFRVQVVLIVFFSIKIREADILYNTER